MTVDALKAEVPALTEFRRSLEVWQQANQEEAFCNDQTASSLSHAPTDVHAQVVKRACKADTIVAS